MPRINFTARKIGSLKRPADGQIEYWDKALPGFGVRLSPGGRKSFVVMYRSGGRKRRFTIGTYPPMSLAKWIWRGCLHKSMRVRSRSEASYMPQAWTRLCRLQA